MPKITAIIPTYRRPQLLKRAIQSVLAQTYPHLQVCVYDNASGDQTEQIVAEIASRDSRVKYHQHPENIGMVPNFNWGLSHVQTPFFSFLCDDDVILPNFYAQAVAHFEKYPTAMLCGGVTAQIDVYNQVSYPEARNWQQERYVEPPEGFVQHMKRHFPTITSILFRREMIEQIGLFDPQFPLTFDVEYALSMSSHPRFGLSLSRTNNLLRY
jgi:glycosyltransferase involved in cell wall biosynthesis